MASFNFEQLHLPLRAVLLNLFISSRNQQSVDCFVFQLTVLTIVSSVVNQDS